MPCGVREDPIAVVFNLKCAPGSWNAAAKADWRYAPITIAFPPRADNLGLTGDEGE
jgi:hypothetical protein